ncbi:MAG: tRNA preQ1(34) S-adenosylmethionine ribosyltransferase-isomerase QueA [Nibricoccus sp.]
MPLPTDLFDYQLPPHLVAQTPAARRDASRLLVVNRAEHKISHHVFSDLPTFLAAGDVLIRNNASVLPARLFAHRPTGGLVECFLLQAEPARGSNVWVCLLRPGKKLPSGATFAHAGAFSAEVLEKQDDGRAIVRFSTEKGENITDVANRLGLVPLPPYINREGTEAERARDIERYQTVYANRAKQVAVAAPTAGLHFTSQLLERLKTSGIEAAEVTLHVGLGTFKPITTPTIEEHEIHEEIYELPVQTQQALFVKTGRRVAVGTTSVRTVEDFLSKHFAPTNQLYTGNARLFIHPPRHFQGVDALITNFHQPRSTLLCLVAAFLAPGSMAGIEWLQEIYAEAIAKEYRFFSYGDAMLIL